MVAKFVSLQEVLDAMTPLASAALLALNPHVSMFAVVASIADWCWQELGRAGVIWCTVWVIKRRKRSILNLKTTSSINIERSLGLICHLSPPCCPSTPFPFPLGSSIPLVINCPTSDEKLCDYRLSVLMFLFGGLRCPTKIMHFAKISQQKKPRSVVGDVFTGARFLWWRLKSKKNILSDMFSLAFFNIAKTKLNIVKFNIPK